MSSYDMLKHFAEAWSHRFRGPELTLKRQYFFKTPLNHFFLSDFDETSAFRKKNTLDFVKVFQKRRTSYRFCVISGYKNDVIDFFKCK